MLTDYARGDLGYPGPRCRHRWSFYCWFDEPVFRKGATHDLRVLVTKCRCGMAKSTLLVDGYRVSRPNYAPDIPTMLLGRELTEAELSHVQQAVGVN